MTKVDQVAEVFAKANLDGCETVMDGSDIRICVGKCRCRETARLAIKAMRYPTEQQLFKMSRAAPEVGLPTIRLIYGAAIEAALSEPVSSPQTRPR